MSNKEVDDLKTLIKSLEIRLRNEEINEEEYKELKAKYEMKLQEDSESMKLIEPTLGLESEFFAMVEEFKIEGDTKINGIGSIDIENFKDSINQAKGHAQGIGLPDG